MSQAARRAKRKAAADRFRKLASANPEKAARKMLAAVVADETARHGVLWRLHKRNIINWQEYEAGIRYQQDELASRDTKTSTLDPDAIGGGSPSIPTAKLSRQVEALVSYRKAGKALADSSRVQAWLVGAVCIEERDLIEGLKAGLQVLVRHYGRTGR